MSVDDRILQRVAVTEAGCWEWQGARSGGRYGHITVNRRNVYVHRAMYEARVAPIASGFTIDHLCRNTICCNPDHLEAVTQLVNNRRAQRTSCVNGHEFTEANTYRCSTHPDVRYCLACKRRRDHETYQRRKAAP